MKGGLTEPRHFDHLVALAAKIHGSQKKKKKRGVSVWIYKIEQEEYSLSIKQRKP